MSKLNENQADDLKQVEGEVITGDEVTISFKERAKRFEQDFEAICLKWNCQLVISPILVPTNHGTWEFSQSQSIGELPKQQ